MNGTHRKKSATLSADPEFPKADKIKPVPIDALDRSLSASPEVKQYLPPIPTSASKPHNWAMRWYTESEAQLIEDNMLGWRDSQSLVAFRQLCPQHSGYTRTVLKLNDAGVTWETARWAAGEATCRLPEGSSFEAIHQTAKNILEAYRHAA